MAAALDRTWSTALVADIGGTWVRFALARQEAAPTPRLRAEARLAVANYPSLIAAARHYLEGLDATLPQPTHAAFAVAGRVEGDRATMTNHPWCIDANECASSLGLSEVLLLNDFTAQAHALPCLAAAERQRIGLPDHALDQREAWTVAVLGPGTGLGVSALLRRSGAPFALSSEGGHAAFAPKTARQRVLLEHLSERFPRVSYERLISGSGLSNLHWAMARRGGGTAPDDLRPEDVTARARGGDAMAGETIEVFCEIFGAFAGDLVLTFGAWDGVYLSGGLVPLLLEELRAGAFRRAFETKGRFSEAMTRVPVHAVLHPQPGLLGAAALAFEGAATEPGVA
ncbi:MAG: glucokinase [Arenimonas sp.]|nr:glucokinase [Arenimonas sp.]